MSLTCSSLTLHFIPSVTKSPSERTAECFICTSLFILVFNTTLLNRLSVWGRGNDITALSSSIFPTVTLDGCQSASSCTGNIYCIICHFVIGLTDGKTPVTDLRNDGNIWEKMKPKWLYDSNWTKCVLKWLFKTLAADGLIVIRLHFMLEFVHGLRFSH